MQQMAGNYHRTDRLQQFDAEQLRTKKTSRACREAFD